MSVHVIPQKQSDKPNLHTFMVIAEKQKSRVLLQISSAINQSSLDCLGNQVVELLSTFLGILHIICRQIYPKKKLNHVASRQPIGNVRKLPAPSKSQCCNRMF